MIYFIFNNNRIDLILIILNIKFKWELVFGVIIYESVFFYFENNVKIFYSF